MGEACQLQNRLHLHHDPLRRAHILSHQNFEDIEMNRMVELAADSKLKNEVVQVHCLQVVGWGNMKDFSMGLQRFAQGFQRGGLDVLEPILK